MSRHIIVYPKDVILLFECNECEYKAEEMSSVAVYNGAPLCQNCHIETDIISCRVVCPDKCPEEGEEIDPVI